MADQKVKTPDGVPLKLLRDTWSGADRQVADGNITYWPLDEAKRLLAAGVAERADPLPGDTEALQTTGA